MAQNRNPQHDKAARWQEPRLRRIGTIRDIAFRGGVKQQGASTNGNNERS